MLRVDHLRVLTGLGEADSGPAPSTPISFEVAAGECLAILGASGSGKTRLLRAIADLDAADGFVFLEGAERRELSGDAWRKRVRYASAEPGWWADTPLQHFPPLTKQANQKLQRTVDSLGLSPGILDQPVAQLSTGERQRLALVRAFADAPQVLLLDEPTAALDGPSTALAEELIRYQTLLNRAVLIVTHDVAQAQRLAKRCLLLDRGQAVMTDTADPLLLARVLAPSRAAGDAQ